MKQMNRSACRWFSIDTNESTNAHFNSCQNTYIMWIFQINQFFSTKKEQVSETNEKFGAPPLFIITAERDGCDEGKVTSHCQSVHYVSTNDFSLKIDYSKKKLSLTGYKTCNHSFQPKFCRPWNSTRVNNTCCPLDTALREL